MGDKEAVGLGILDGEGIIYCIDLGLPSLHVLEGAAYLSNTHEDDLSDNLLSDLVHIALGARTLDVDDPVRIHEVDPVQVIFDLDILLGDHGFFEEGSSRTQVFSANLTHGRICNQPMALGILHF